MNELLKQQLRKSFGEAFDKVALSDGFKDFITQVDASYSELEKETNLLDKALNSIYTEMNASNKSVIKRNNDLYELLQKRSDALALQTEEADKALNLLSQYREAIDTSLIVTMTDPEGIITYVNDNFCNVSGYTLDEAVHHSHNIIRHPNTSPDLYKKLWETITNKKIWKSTMHNQKKDGGSYYVSVNIIPFLDVNGNIINYISIQEDITSKILAQQKLKAEQVRTSAIFNHQESVVVITNKTEGLLEANQAFYSFSGFKDLKTFRENHLSVCDLFQVKDGYLKENSAEHYWAEEIIENPDKLHRTLMLNKNGEARTFKVYSRYIELTGETSILSTFTDITDSEMLREKAEKAEKAKSEFLANMSHEIRTPLNGIFGFLQLLETTELDKLQKEYVDIAQGSMQTLLGVINNILDFSKIENGKIEADLIELNVYQLFKTLHESFFPLARSKKITYTLKIDKDIEETLEIDEQHIRQILQNFINNALKFTPENGSVTIYVDLISTQKDRQRIRITVKDTGIGIPENKLDTIMQPFSQVDSSTTRKFGGTGLGLSISKSLIELMGGELQISSEESGGSAFSFEIDALKCCSSPQHLQNEEVIEDTLVKAVPDSNEQNVFNILVAEDYEVNRMFIGMLLNGYSDLTYDFAINGEEALSLLDTNAYDLILMDINMPVMNGCDATRIIRQELKLDIPIIALTANALDGDRKRFLETGMNDYLAKPLDISDMDRIMNTYRHP